MKDKQAKAQSCSLNISYTRILLALVGFSASTNFPIVALSLWILGALLDLFDDGWEQQHQRARRKRIHVVALELFADNLLRTVGWTAAALTQPSRFLCLATSVLLLEWTTLLTTHVHVAWDIGHWKRTRVQDPAWVQAFFRDRFQRPLGRLGMFGLFAADLVCFASAKGVEHYIPFFVVIQVVAFCGRFLVALVEVWLCVTFGAFLVHELRAKKDWVVQLLTFFVRDTLSLHVSKVL